MLLLILNLKDERLIYKVVEVMLEMELTDATVVDSEALENLAVQTHPLFSEIGSLFGQNLAYQRTLLVRVSDRDAVRDLVRMCARDGVDLRDPAIASLWLLPCERLEPEADDETGAAGRG